MFGIGMTELMVIFVIALLVLGPKRLPGLARSLGKGLAEFRRASTDMRREFLDVAEEVRIDPRSFTAEPEAEHASGDGDGDEAPANLPPGAEPAGSEQAGSQDGEKDGAAAGAEAEAEPAGKRGDG